MRTAISVVVMIAAALVGFFIGTGINEAMGTAILFAVIAGFACTIQAMEGKKK